MKIPSGSFLELVMINTLVRASVKRFMQTWGMTLLHLSQEMMWFLLDRDAIWFLINNLAAHFKLKLSKHLN